MNLTILKKIVLLLALSTTSLFGFGAQKLSGSIKKIIINGYIGQKINDCIEHRVKTQNVDEIVNPFFKQDEVNGMWGSEFWGKWVQGAIGSYRYHSDSSLYQMIRRSEQKLMSAQLSDGYIGNYDKQHQLGGWDVWGRKYCTLGLLKWYDLSGDKNALKSACRLIDYTMTQIGPDKSHIFNCGYYKGMASSSILEPVMLLYRRTMNKKYLDFAKFIVSDWEQDGGPQLIAKANVPVGQRFPVHGASQWWTRDNGQKAYEMMSCYVGLLELYKVTHNENYLKTVETVVRHIMDEEINICGSGAAFECWYGGNKRQTRPAYNSMETCVTFTWMQLNERLLQITGNPLYADNIENTAYNALLAAMKGDASQIAKYTPLEGFRHQGGNQCGLNINCCNANAPRAFAMIPRVAYMTRGADSIEINLYSPSTAQIQLGKNVVELQMATNYPVTDSIEITINPQHVGKFNLCLRIPAWSQKTNLLVNGQKVQNITAGSYCTLNRTWQKGDKLTLQLDLRTRLYELNGMQALKRGPITLARDSRFQDGTVDETAIIQANNGFVDMQPVAPQEGMWMAFTAPIVMGTDQENFGTPRAIHFCDFASAGNSWDQQQRYRVWLTKTIDPTMEPQ